MKKRNNKTFLEKDRSFRAFTLIEVLIVSLILSIISLGLFSTLSSGVKIWKRVNSQLAEEDSLLFFDRMALDFRNSFNYTDIPFVGRDDSCEFASIANSQRLNKKTVGNIRYIFLKDKKIIQRQQNDYSGIYTQEEPKNLQTLKGVKNARFIYYSYDEEKKENAWFEEWLEESLPMSVRLEIDFDSGENVTTVVRTFKVPVGK